MIDPQPGPPSITGITADPDHRPPPPVGRAGELGRVNAFLDATGPHIALLLDGPAGIGKTELWEYALRHAYTTGTRVLASRASAAEARMPWVGLTDLLAGIPLDGLPEPQKAALRAATLRDTPDAPLDERTVGTALLTLLTTAGPTLVAVDDLPHLDAPSAGALRFALRRLTSPATTAQDNGPAGVRFIATARGTRPTPPPLDALAAATTRLTVGPLTPDAVIDLLATRLGVRLPRPVALRVHATSGGNPLYALELARALAAAEITLTPGVPLPVPAGLTALVAGRIATLAADVLDVAAGTAASWHYTAAGLPPDAVRRAGAAGLVVVDTTRGTPAAIRAAHPLLAAAAYDALPTDRRRALHARLAASAPDTAEAARHAALATTGADPDVARRLDIGAASALAAGAPDLAADLARLAIERTPPADDPLPRWATLADALFRSGDTEGSSAALHHAIATAPDGPTRARYRIQLAEILIAVDSNAAVHEQVQAAITDAAGEPAIEAEALLTLAGATDDIALADASATRAVALLDTRDPDLTVLGPALAQASAARFRAGRGLDHDAFRRAIAIESRHPRRRIADRSDTNYAALLKYADDLDGAQNALETLLAEARATADLSGITFLLGHLPQIGLWRGDLHQAAGWAEEAVAVCAQGGLDTQAVTAAYNLAAVRAYQGRLTEAEALLQPATASTSLWARQRTSGLLGFISLSRGDAFTAAAHLDNWDATATAIHLTEPGYSRSHLDYLDALVAVGRTHDAAAFLDRLERLVHATGRTSAAAVAHAGHAMLDATAGHAAAAREQITAALAATAATPLRFQHARTLLVAGRVHRRAKAKSDAQTALRTARDMFDGFGATAWSDIVTSELARVNVRPPAPATLTPTERAAAELAAGGLTNREIAANLFLAVKTVEANLNRAYRKLGIRGRAELGRRLAPPTQRTPDRG